MALDGIVTRAIVHELQICVGARINKIHQPSPHDIIFNLRADRENRRLILSANPTYPRVQLTDQTFVNPQEAPMFCMLLRKYCEGGVIEAITQSSLERIIHIDIRQRDELGDISNKRIIIELMGRHSNIILVDPATGVQLDGIHHVTPSISSYRIVMPGFQYTEPPEQHKLNPLETDESTFLESFRGVDPEPSPSEQGSWLVSTFSGFSPLIGQEIQLLARTMEDSSPEQDAGVLLWTAFEQLMTKVKAHDYNPVIGDNAKGKSIFSVLPLAQIVGETAHYNSISECLEDYYGHKAERDTVKQKVSDLIRFLQNERSKNVKKLTNLAKDQDEAKDAEHFRIWGELLLPALHQLHKGATTAELVNYYDEDQKTETIPLDPLLTPSENAQRYFKKYNKFKNSLVVIDEQLIKTHEEIAYVEGLLQQLAFASLSDVDEIRDELIQQGYLRDRSKKTKKKKKNDRPTLHVYTSSEGIEIYVGKNNLQNEYVTNRLGNPNDTWLHTKDIPGSHVLIRSVEYGEDTLEEAAQLAAYFSQAKESSSVPVDSTRIRHVRKPSGAKPGYVIYDHQKTLFITPNEQLIKRLPHTLKNG
ncbi:putative ribosome quality control (RQC) complex YloA/Tae2 family protein [Paenibacillus shirakamiensis]|uniref:Rqc2 homolog RqcH n=1 Tax=Paenibacillus shirakamiensis TaxID=1265935 RepID=A0ABS4JC94_9BACL|nr:NFACT RNA binding domain-containing protein [Paenibacillus shirakamiensis]MBP1999340.1 putative ribosome quality control (RQC) complex YloA/Tae2 family protein [Paenibacillus shirakamiensis]